MVDSKSPLCRKQTDVFLWLMKNTESFRSVPDRLDMSNSSLHLCVTNVADALFRLIPLEIVFPTDISFLHAITRTFEKFPGVIGCVDGTYVTQSGDASAIKDRICHELSLM